MLIALDIGNSHIRFGGFHGDDLQFVASMATDDRQTGEQYACQIRAIFALHGVDTAQIDGAVLCSVVPAVTPLIARALTFLTTAGVLNVSAGVKTGLNLRIDQPKALGSDLVANAVWAVRKGRTPCVVADLGTVTTLIALDQNGVMTGSVIATGVKISLDAVKARAAQLPAVQMQAPKRGVLGRNTRDAIRAGAIYGAAAMVDGLIARIADELGQPPFVLLTGGSARVIAPYLHTKAEFDPNVTLRGLQVIWEKNQKG